MTPLVVIGAGGFGRECHDVVVAINEVNAVWDFIGFIDDDEPDEDLMARRGARWLGSTAEFERLAGTAFVVGIGDSEVRRELADRATSAGLGAATLVHPSSTIGLDVVISPGTVICSHVSVTTNVRIGEHVHLDQNVTVAHDVSIGNFSRANPGATISGSVQLGEGVTVGANATILQGLAVGGGSVVGAGAVVIGDVSSGDTVVGVPARTLARVDPRKGDGSVK